jgi:GTP cyclohydrolase II
MNYTVADLQSVHRAIADLRRGSAVLCRNNEGSTALIGAAEQVSSNSLDNLAKQASSSPQLLISRQRGHMIGLKLKSGMDACSILIPERFEPKDILGLIGDIPLTVQPKELTVLPEKKNSMATIILMLMRTARLMPAALASHISIRDERTLMRWASDRGILVVDENAIRSFEAGAASHLREAARARLPLAEAEKAEITIFRPDDGGTEHFALIIHPDNGNSIETPPLVRIHSQCITGDILGSLKCDCGNQLRKAIQQMATSTGGIFIYLAQEGRDIGLVNKLKAYALQDEGLDTVEANHALGFETDHRYFLPAAVMLDQLGYDTIRLMTNNPDKIDQIRKAGINVTDRIPLVVESNPYNSHYLDIKKTRTGHLFD